MPQSTVLHKNRPISSYISKEPENKQLRLIRDFYNTESSCCKKAKEVADVLKHNKLHLKNFSKIDTAIKLYNNLSIDVFSDISVTDDQAQSIASWINELNRIFNQSIFDKKIELLKNVAVFIDQHQKELFELFNVNQFISNKDKKTLKDNLLEPALRVTRIQSLCEELRKNYPNKSEQPDQLDLLIQRVKLIADQINSTVKNVNSNQSSPKKRPLDEADNQSSKRSKFTNNKLLFDNTTTKINVEAILEKLDEITTKSTEKLKLLQLEFEKIQFLAKQNPCTGFFRREDFPYSVQQLDFIAMLKKAYLAIVRATPQSQQQQLNDYLEKIYPRNGISEPEKFIKLLNFNTTRFSIFVHEETNTIKELRKFQNDRLGSVAAGEKVDNISHFYPSHNLL